MSGGEGSPLVVAATEADADGRVLVLSVKGELDLAVAEELSGELERAGLDGFDGAGVVLDLSGVSFMDSSGLHAVIVATEAMGAAERPYALVVPAESPVNSILELTQVAERLPVYRDGASALDALSASFR
jgi:anti-sigma B factor antagonist